MATRRVKTKTAEKPFPKELKAICVENPNDFLVVERGYGDPQTQIFIKYEPGVGLVCWRVPDSPLILAERIKAMAECLEDSPEPDNSEFEVI